MYNNCKYTATKHQVIKTLGGGSPLIILTTVVHDMINALKENCSC